MGSRILVVDDDLLVAMSVTDMLEDLGFEACDAMSAAQALDLLQTDGEIVLVLTDLHMPDTNGYQLADRARTMRPGLPVILTTGDESEATKGSGFPMLYKPYTRQQLSSAIKEAYRPRVH